MNNDYTVTVTFKANTAELDSALDKVEKSVGSAGKNVEKSAESTGNNASNKLINPFKRVGDVLTSLLTNGVSKALGAVTDSIGSAVKRIDTLNNFPKVMSNFGVSAEDANKMINELDEGVQGLPTSLDSIASLAQSFVPVTDSTEQATQTALALNNALLAGGAPAEQQAAAMEQFRQALAKGQPELEDWRALESAMPAQLQQVAKALGLGSGAMSEYSTTGQGLYDAMKDGKITMDDFNKAMVGLNKDGLGNFPSFAEQAENASGGLQTTFERAQTAIVRGVTDIIESIGTDNITKAISNIGKTFELILKKAGDFAKFATEHPNMVMSIIGGVAAITAINKVGGALSKAKNTISSAVGVAKSAGSTIGKFFGHFKNSKKDIEGASGAIDKVTSTSKNLDSSAPKQFTFGQSISSFFKNIGQTISGGISAVAGPLNTLAGEIGKIATTIAKGLGSAISGFITQFSNPAVLTGALGFAATAASIAAAITLIGGAIGLVNPALSVFMTGVVLPLGTFLATTLLMAINAITTAVINLANMAIIPIINTISGSIMGLITALSNALINLTQGAIIPLINTISGAFATAVQTVGDLVSQVGETIANIIGQIGDSISQVVDAIGGFVESCGNAIGRVIDSISNGISNIINSIANLIRSVGGADWYGTGFGITRNFAAGLIDGAIQLVQDGLNKIINGVLDTPIIGDGLKLLGINKNPVNLSGLQFGAYAVGGVIDSPTIGLVGEAGREVVMPLEHNTGWITELANELNRRGGGNGPTITNNYDVHNDTDVELISREQARLIRRTA